MGNKITTKNNEKIQTFLLISAENFLSRDFVKLSWEFILRLSTLLILGEILAKFENYTRPALKYSRQSVKVSFE